MSRPSAPHPFTPELTPAAASLSPADFPHFAPTGTGANPSAEATARDAVATVIKLVDLQAARADGAAAAQSVNLGFRFGEEHLAVRVELRGNEVHTQFATSSSELRAAVAAQWSASTGDNAQGRQQSSSGQRPYHFAPPQFSAGSSFADGRGGRNPLPNPSSSASSSASRLIAGSLRPTSTAPSAAAAPQPVSLAPGRLHAFA